MVLLLRTRTTGVNVFREDEVTNPDGAEESLKNAPKKKDNQYMVPKTV